jgi:hypothetical protein
LAKPDPISLSLQYDQDSTGDNTLLAVYNLNPGEIKEKEFK